MAQGTTLTTKEFLEACRREGFTGHSEKGTATHVSMDGSNDCGHNGSFHVPPGKNSIFLNLIARTLAGGHPLCISANGPPDKDGVFAFFVDIDAKKMLDPDQASEEKMLAVAGAIFSLAEPMFRDEKWSAFMMDRKRLPRMLYERWPSLCVSISDILSEFRSNPFTIAEVQPTTGQNFTLTDLFITDVDAQNWIGSIFAAAVAYHTQNVVRTFYPTTDPKNKLFDAFAMASINGTSKPSDKIGAHVHMFRLRVTIDQILSIASALQNTLVRLAGDVMAESVDLGTFTPGFVNIRIPFNWKAEEIAKAQRKESENSNSNSKRKRTRIEALGPISYNQQKYLINKKYVCVAYLPASKNGAVDLDSDLGRYLCID
ncbi:hypothetical protein, partial [Asticcacaulis sp.]|uniref:hypothetical protein n=1 Tax=Asticcacaulis sp. TaxID=1872648 RepID=UPI002628CFC6